MGCGRDRDAEAVNDALKALRQTAEASRNNVDAQAAAPDSMAAIEAHSNPQYAKHYLAKPSEGIP